MRMTWSIRHGIFSALQKKMTSGSFGIWFSSYFSRFSLTSFIIISWLLLMKWTQEFHLFCFIISWRSVIRFIYSLFYSVVSLPLLSHCSIVTLMMMMRCCAMCHVGNHKRDGQLLTRDRSFFLLYLIIIFSVFLLFVVWWCSSLTVYDCRIPYSTVLDRRSRSCHPLLKGRSVCVSAAKRNK